MEEIRRGGRWKVREGGMGKDEGLFSAAVSVARVLKTLIRDWAERS